MKLKRDHLRIYLVIVAVGLGTVFFTYVAIQQSLRLSANDLPEQLAFDTAAKLADGVSPSEAVGTASVNEASSLAPFVTIVDASYHAVASSGHVGARSPLPPVGVFQFTKDHGRDAITWGHDQVRDAAVVVSYGSGANTGYVVAAHSLHQVESNTNTIAVLALLAAIGVVVAPIIIFVLV